MKRIYTTLLSLCFTMMMMAQGWPANYGGVMLQGFYWDSFSDTRWTNLESQAKELGLFYDLVWLPQSGNCSGTSMGYDDCYWFPGGNGYNSSFGNESQLRSLIKTFKENHIGAIADVVINHRKSTNGWFGFPSETYKGNTYTMSSTDVVSDDDGGKAKTEADKLGVRLGNAEETDAATGRKGEGWDGMRDLDHKSTNVQTICKAYTKMLLEDLGYTGFRYDMVKGYPSKYTAMYNANAGVKYSVGEYWDGNVTILKKWIDGTKIDGTVQSAAFDFAFRYTVRNALRGSTNDNDSKNWKQSPNWSLLGNASLMSDASYRRYSVTFIENHDTEYRSSSEQQDPIRRDTIAGNAWLLANPGTPCVFLKHWKDYKDEIKQMIEARKIAGINNQSVYANESSGSTGVVRKVGSSSSDYRLLVAVGSNAGSYKASGEWVQVLSGYHYKYFLNTSTETAWADVPSQEVSKDVKVKLTAVSKTAGAKLVYTTDGTDPTAKSKAVNSGATITAPKGSVLKVGLLKGSAVSGIITREYWAGESFTPRKIDVYVNLDKCDWSDKSYCNFWSWGGDGSHAPAAGAWPGDKVTETVTLDGKQWFHKTFTINSSTDFVSFVFSTGTGSPQTVNLGSDFGGYRQSVCFEITSEKEGSKYLVNDVTDQHPSSINAITTKPAGPFSNAYYTLSGQKIDKPTQKGIYIHNGKKIIVR